MASRLVLAVPALATAAAAATASPARPARAQRRLARADDAPRPVYPPSRYNLEDPETVLQRPKRPQDDAMRTGFAVEMTQF